MKAHFLLTSLIVLLSGCGDGGVTVKDRADVYTARLPKFEGTRHGDGVAKVSIRGIVVDRDSNAAISGAKFHVEPTGIFSDLDNEKIKFASGRDGSFHSEIIIGASIMMGGKKDGTVYQTAKAKLVVEKEGYAPLAFLVDYEMPPIKILLKKK